MKNLIKLICFLIFLFVIVNKVEAQNDKKLHPNRNHPMIPFNTNFWNYWDHYWTTWLDNHPKYEMIEVTTYDNPNDKNYKLIRVFLSEKFGSKKQYYYLNDSTAMKRSRANSFYRDIEYQRIGEDAKPQGLYIKFRDKDGELIEWTINFNKKSELKPNIKGLTPSIHSVGYILLYHFRTLTAETKEDKVLFNGVNYAFDESKKGKSSWYNKDTYSAVQVYGKNTFSIKDGKISNSWNRSFIRQGNSNIYKSNKLGKENYVQFEVDPQNQIKKYQHLSFGHSLTFEFSPPLPNFSTAKNGQESSFTVSFDNYKKLMKGRIRVVVKGDDELIFQWIHESPEWSVWRPFKSIFRFKDNGYELIAYE